MLVKILGNESNFTKKQYEYCLDAIKDLKIDAKVEYITNFEEIRKNNIKRMPAMIIDDDIMYEGEFKTKNEIEIIIEHMFFYNYNLTFMT